MLKKTKATWKSRFSKVNNWLWNVSTIDRYLRHGIILLHFHLN